MQSLFMNKAYRYEWKCYATLDNSGDAVGSRCELMLYEYDVIKVTAKGFWIKGPFFKRFVLICKRQYAHLTKESALKSYLKRRQAYKRILEARLLKVEQSIEYAKFIT